jgi:type I restriction enzyme R subunit
VRSSQEEVIAKINDLFSGDHPDSGVRNVVTHVRDRLEDSETVTQQAQRNSLAQFSASPDPSLSTESHSSRAGKCNDK